MGRKRPPSDVTRRLLGTAVRHALFPVKDVAALWTNTRAALIEHVTREVRAVVKHTNGTPITDEEIVDVLVAELKRRGIKVD